MFNREADVYDRIENRTVSTLEFGHWLYIKGLQGFISERSASLVKTRLGAETSGSILSLAPPLTPI